jgi:murein DD-endopeptidase MepM/ murein hydrolase activator NlpD
VLLALTLTHAAKADEPAPLKRLDAREQTLAQHAKSAEQAAREQARAAYRLARRRQLGFVAEPQARLAEARAADLALVAARRGAAEARAISAELARVRQERAALRVAAARPPEMAGEHLEFQRPVRGTQVGAAGLRVDPGTGVEVRQDGVQLLARMNEPVLAAAAGRVRRVEALPQGGFAVVMEHPGGWTSVLGGLREVSVAPGETVEARGTLGLAGRNLDGAAVVTLELWHGRSPVDPAGVLRRGR